MRVLFAVGAIASATTAAPTYSHDICSGVWTESVEKNVDLTSIARSYSARNYRSVAYQVLDKIYPLGTTLLKAGTEAHVDRWFDQGSFKTLLETMNTAVHEECHSMDGTKYMITNQPSCGNAKECITRSGPFGAYNSAFPRRGDIKPLVPSWLQSERGGYFDLYFGAGTGAGSTMSKQTLGGFMTEWHCYIQGNVATLPLSIYGNAQPRNEMSGNLLLEAGNPWAPVVWSFYATSFLRQTKSMKADTWAKMSGEYKYIGEMFLTLYDRSMWLHSLGFWTSRMYKGELTPKVMALINEPANKAIIAELRSKVGCAGSNAPGPSGSPPAANPPAANPPATNPPATNPPATSRPPAAGGGVDCGNGGLTASSCDKCQWCAGSCARFSDGVCRSVGGGSTGSTGSSGSTPASPNPTVCRGAGAWAGGPYDSWCRSRSCPAPYCGMTTESLITSDRECIIVTIDSTAVDSEATTWADAAAFHGIDEATLKQDNSEMQLEADGSFKIGQTLRVCSGSIGVAESSAAQVSTVLAAGLAVFTTALFC